MVTPNYPKNLKIGCYDWMVDVVPDLRNLENGEKLYGQCDPEHLTIRVNAHIESEQIRAETLWHEIMHAVWNHFHLDEKEDEESTVACLATGTVMVLKDNPELKKYFWEVWK